MFLEVSCIMLYFICKERINALNQFKAAPEMFTEMTLAFRVSLRLYGKHCESCVKGQGLWSKNNGPVKVQEMIVM